MKINPYVSILNITFFSIKNLFEKKISRWILANVILTLLSLLLCIYILAHLFVNLISPFILEIPFIGSSVSDYIFYGMFFGGIIISNIFFVPVATTLFSLFQESILIEIEKKYYPEIITPLKSNTYLMLYAGFKILVWSLIVNIILFPLSLIWGGTFLWLPVYIIIIGFLISKEYSDAINLRRYSYQECKEIKVKYFWEYWLVGIIGSILFILPLINLLTAPYISIVMLHIINKKMESGPLPDK